MTEERIAVACTDVSKTFRRGMYALEHVSLSFRQGETYFLYGDSATGKTTFLRMLTKELVPDSGTITVFGDDITQFTPKQTVLYRRALGMIWQDLKLLSQKTVFENVALPLLVRELPYTTIKARVITFLRETGLYGVRNEFPYLLPPGICQKIAIVRALITDPLLIIADEPMAHLDTNAENEVWSIVHHFKPKDATIIWSTSQRYVVKTYPGTVVKFEHGKITQS